MFPIKSTISHFVMSLESVYSLSVSCVSISPLESLGILYRPVALCLKIPVPPVSGAFGVKYKTPAHLLFSSA